MLVVNDFGFEWVNIDFAKVNNKGIYLLWLVDYKGRISRPIVYLENELVAVVYPDTKRKIWVDRMNTPKNNKVKEAVNYLIRESLQNNTDFIEYNIYKLKNKTDFNKMLMLWELQK